MTGATPSRRARTLAAAIEAAADEAVEAVVIGEVPEAWTDARDSPMANMVRGGPPPEQPDPASLNSASSSPVR